MLNMITRANVRPDYMLELFYSDGAVVLVDFKPVIAEGGVFAALADPKSFAAVTVGARGRFIEWPGQIDFCADALRLAGQLSASGDLQISTSSRQ